MATRRKYRPKGYRSGGAVMADTPIAESSDELSVHSDHADPAPVAVTADAPAPPPEIADGVPPPTPEAHDAVARALEAQRRAEELQRQPLQPPQLSERRIAFIRQHPELNDRANEEAVIGYWKQGLRLGIPDDTDEIDNYVLHGLRFERAAREQRHGEAQTEQAAPAAPQTRPEASQQRPMPAPPARRSMPMVAPVSREVPNASGQRQQSMKLTEEERQIARASIVDRPDMPPLTNAQKEYLYWKNREKYRGMVADGTYSEQKGR